MAAVIDPDYQKEPGLQLHNGSKEEDVFGTQTVQLAVSLSYPGSILIVNREVQQPRTEKDMVTRRSAEVLPEGEKQLKWMVEEEDDNLGAQDQLLWWEMWLILLTISPRKIKLLPKLIQSGSE